MDNKIQMNVAILIVGTATGLAQAGSLNADRAYASELLADAGARTVLNQGNSSNVEVSAGLRFSYDYSSADGRTPTDDETTVGFGIKDAAIVIQGDVTENMHAKISFDFGPNDSGAGGQGTAVLEDAFVDWSVNENFTLRVGQFVPSGSAEGSTSEWKIAGATRSVVHEYLDTPSWTQGIEARFGGENWSGAIGFNDGLNTASTAFSSGMEADFGFNARFDFYSDSDKARFGDQTSWRGSSNGWRVGAGFQFESMGSTNPSGTETDDLFYAIDATYEGDGWLVRGAFYGTDIERGTEHDNIGFEIAGAVFLSDQWEVFGRWDTLILDDDAGAGQTTDEDTFNFLAIGANYYFVPESHAAKFTVELGFSLDETGDIVSGTGDVGVPVFGAADGSSSGSSGYFLENTGEDGQFRLSATMQWLF